MKKLIGFVCAVVGITTGALATDYTWTGGGGKVGSLSYSWKDKNNWGGSGYPYALYVKNPICDSIMVNFR